MANISLRAYIRKIENQIDNSQIDQAIAHCKHILQTYPKHIDSYRLLGKALLEKQKYGDASDIFQRVLSSVPDDFVSHIGMSMIREDENNLDAAIWHMERAFEVQPSNKAVQDELRRLYTSRDGIAPPKIRLTRGALVRMYTRGELYNQAIAEILAALSEDPNRVDLEVILARIYFQLGKKVEATETCSKLISKLPYCYEANKILTEILPGTSREEDEKIFRQRVVDLEPYFQYVNNKTLSTEDVSDSLIMLDYLDWDPSLVADDQPDWAQSIGFALENDQTSNEDFSSWVDELDNKAPEIIAGDDIAEPGKELDTEITGEPEQLQEFEEQRAVEQNDKQDQVDNLLIPSDSADQEEGLPDWIKDAGWEVSKEEDQNVEKGFTIPSNLPVDDQISTYNAEEEEEEEEIEPAEIPSWLQAIAPAGELFDLSDDVDESEVKNLEDLFDNLEKDKSEFVRSESDIQWENEFSKETDASLEETLLGFDSSSVAGINDEGMTDFVPETELEPQDINVNDLDWIKGLSINDELEEIEEIPETTSNENFSVVEKDEDINKQSLDQIINGLEEGEIGEKDQGLSDDDWLNSLVIEEEKSKSETESIEEIENEEIPDWIKSVVDEEGEQPSVSSPEEVDSLPDWLSISDENVESQIDDIRIIFDEEDDLSIPLENKDEFVEESDSFDDKSGELSFSELLDNKISNDLELQKDDELLQDLKSSTPEIEKYEEELEDIETTSVIEEQAILPIDEKLEESFDLDLENPIQEVEHVEDLVEEAIQTAETEDDELDNVLDWMEQLTSKHAADDETLLSSSKESSETPLEWLSKEADLPQNLSDDQVSTPSWLKELEIETEDSNIKADKLLEGIPSLNVDSTEKDTSADFSGEMDTEKISLNDFENFLDQLENEIDGNKEDLFDQEIDKEIPAVEDLTPETNKLEFPQENGEVEELGSVEDLVDEIEEIESQEKISESSLEDMKTEEQVKELETPFVEGVVREENILDKDQEIEHIEESPKTSEELPEHVEEIQESIDQEPEPDAQAEEEVEDTQPIKITENRQAALEMANQYLDSGNIEDSMEIYGNLIAESFELDGIILNIQNALDHHFPIDINLWQALGDAYLKNNQLQNALDAYSKAEDLLS